MAALQTAGAASGTVSDAPSASGIVATHNQKFTSQMELGRYLTAQYHIRTPNELSSCETCHR
jgi:hypothetical protein